MSLFTRSILIGSSLAILTGCGASMIKPIGTGSKYAPTNESSDNGEVIYRLGRMDAFNEYQREDAYKKMYSQCQGKYSIVNEWVDTTSNTTAFSQSSGNASANNTHAQASGQSSSAVIQDETQYKHIVFKCEK